MFYIPAATLSTPVVLKQIPTVSLLPTAVPILSAGLVYPNSAYIVKATVNDSTTKSQTLSAASSVQHIVHHHAPVYYDCCELCCPYKDEATRSRETSPKNSNRVSRRDQYQQTYVDPKLESIEKKIQCIKEQLRSTSCNKRDQSTETIDFYHPPPNRPKTVRTPSPVPYKQHYDAPKPRPHSSSSRRGSPLPREPWRSTNQHEYPWRDAHLPAYRQYTLNKSISPHRPKSELTTSEPQTKSCRAVRFNTSCYGDVPPSQVKTDHSFYTDIPIKYTSKQNYPISYKLSSHENDCLHILPKNVTGVSLDPPYLKIINSPVTYLH